MWFRVDPRLSTPVYQQIVDGVRESVAKGLLRHGDRLPSVRELATMMTLNHNTVAKAYQELERERVIEVIRGRGTYVAAPKILPDRAERIKRMSDVIRQLLVETHHLQMTDDDVVRLFHEAVNEWHRERGKHRNDVSN